MYNCGIINCASLIDGVAEKAGFPAEFPAALKRAAVKAAKTAAAAAEREDFRDAGLLTIDGEDARDFDDAVAATALSGGGFRLLVAIADVSAYVAPESPLDLEARQRGNSVYLPDRVLPMLPAALSDDACSLRPDEDRLCLVCDMRIEAGGDIRQYRFARGIMRSKRRAIYEQAAEEMKKGPRAMKNLAAAARQLRKKRRENGAFMMERPEMRLTIKRGVPHLGECPRTAAHIAIEECMIAANRCAADFLIRRRMPALHRVHKKPTAENLKKLRTALKPLHIDFPHARPCGADFGKALEEVASRDPQLADCLTPIFLGALARAEYAHDEKTGHFGLACSRYLHFTSPIRRYPDLLAHRAILAGLGDDSGGALAKSLSKLNWKQTGAHCSQTESVADKAGWEVRQRLLCGRAEKHIGKTFAAIVSGGVHFGVFVTVPELGVDGLVKVSSLPGFWKHAPATNQFTSRQTGETLGLGDRLRLRLTAVAPEKGRADFEFVDLN